MCDGLFLIEDTARHNNFTPDPQEIVEHITGCLECSETADAFDDYAEATYDPDAPILYWPDDNALAEYPYDTLAESDGHA